MRNLLFIFVLTVGSHAFAQMVEVRDGHNSERPTSGKEKAQGYFKERQGAKEDSGSPRKEASEGATPRYLAIHIGSFFSSQGYKWGNGDQTDIGKLNAGITYRLGEWVNSMDLAMRIDYTNFHLEEGNSRKLSFGAIITFPDANSRFPLYFGAGLGAGFMLKTINEESVLALDYSLFGGVRFLNVIDNVGFMVETGMKNHIHLLSDGQFNGIFLNVGTVFAF